MVSSTPKLILRGNEPAALQVAVGVALHWARLCESSPLVSTEDTT